MSQTTITHTGETKAQSLPGIPLILLLMSLNLVAIYAMISGVEGLVFGLAITTVVVSTFLSAGLYTIQPNEAVAILLFGAYRGTDRTAGLRWVWPWLARKKISMRVRNVTSDKLKVNDKDGNPIEIAANVVWRVHDSAQALFDVDDYESFNRIEIDTALRDIAAHYSYDHAEEGQLTLRSHAEEVATLLGERLNARLKVGGM